MLARAVFDRDAFERQTGGDADLRTEIIEMFLEDCPVRVREIREAVTGKDARALVASAHALKGRAGAAGGARPPPRGVAGACGGAWFGGGGGGAPGRPGREQNLDAAPALL